MQSWPMVSMEESRDSKCSHLSTYVTVLRYRAHKMHNIPAAVPVVKPAQISCLTYIDCKLKLISWYQNSEQMRWHITGPVTIYTVNTHPCNRQSKKARAKKATSKGKKTTKGTLAVCLLASLLYLSQPSCYLHPYCLILDCLVIFCVLGFMPFHSLGSLIFGHFLCFLVASILAISCFPSCSFICLNLCS